MARTASDRPRIGGVRWADGPVPAAVVDGLRAALGPDARLLVLDRPDGRWRGSGAVRDADPDALPDPGGPGSFATARIDGAALVLARDAVGHRSLYFAAPRPGVLVFASTLHGVLGSGLVPRRLDVAQLPAYLAMAYVPGTRTLVAGVSALAAGTTLRADDRGTGISSFFALPFPPAVYDSEDTLRRTLRATLEDAVRSRLPAPGTPLGATLSGGIDSSLVLALARRLHDGPMRCLSVSFGPPHADELAWSGLVARALDVEQQVVLVRTEDVRDRFDEAVFAMSEPNGDPLTVPNLMLFEAASAFCSGLLNGEGGDPTFGGPKNAPMLLAELLDPDTPRGETYLRAHQRMFDELPWLLVPELGPERAARRLQAELLPWFDGSRGLLDALMAINVVFKGAWHILPKVDALGAQFGVRPLSPLFDRRVVELAFRVPPSLKRSGAIEKHLLKEAVRDLLPDAVVDRPKSGMMVPVEAWFTGPLQRWATERLLDGLAPHDLFRREALEDLLAGRRLGLRPRRGIKIWSLLTLEAWIRGHGLS